MTADSGGQAAYTFWTVLPGTRRSGDGSFVTESCQRTVARERGEAGEADLAATNLITLTTDFGSADHFVGTMRGVILGVNPAAQVIDLCNEVTPFDILDGALTIAQAYQYFPADSIHLVVVDPGVGSERKALMVTTARHILCCSG